MATCNRIGVTWSTAPWLAALIVACAVLGRTGRAEEDAKKPAAVKPAAPAAESPSPEEAPAEKPSPAEEAPTEEVPAADGARVEESSPPEEAPTEEAMPAEESPVQEVPDEETAPVEESSPADEASPEEAAPDEEAVPLEEPAEEAPSAEAGPAEETSPEEAPSGEAMPVEETAEPQPAPKITGPKSLFDLLGIDRSHFERLTDGEPWHEGEAEVMLKIMYRFPDVRLGEMERWAHQETPVTELAADPDAVRGEFFHLRGHVTLAEVEQPLPEVRERFLLDEYYRCRFLIGELEEPAIVFARRIPDAWARGEPLDERAAAYGVFLKVADADPEHPLPVFVAPRIAWYPQTMLGNLGMDVGLLDELGQQQAFQETSEGEKPKINPRELRLSDRDREAFFQMLAATERARPGELRREARKEIRAGGSDKRYSVVPLFNDPASQQGKLALLSGSARRVVPVQVTDKQIVDRFGIQKYYEVELFTEDSQGNPLVFCVHDIPKDMPTGEGPRFAEHVSVAGFFLKTWAYRIRPLEAASDQDTRWQLAPLLVGREVKWHPRESAGPNPWVGAIAGILFIVALAGVWLAVWGYSRGDKRFHDQTLAKQFAMDSGVSLDELGIEANGEPDFSGLDKGDE